MRHLFVGARLRSIQFLLLGLLLGGGGLPALQAKVNWDPVSPEELAATDCRYDPGASAEMLFVRQTLDASADSEWVDNYRRIKIYSLKGVEDMGVMSIEYPASEKVWNLAARVIKPGAAPVEYDHKSFNETVAAKYKSAKWKRWTLAVPALEVGDILELQWSASIESETSLYSWWYSQLNLPVRRFNFAVKDSAHDCRLLWFNSGNDIDKKSRNQLQLNLEFLPAFVEEPHMPPVRDVRSWYLLLYTDRMLRWFSSEDIWKEWSTYHDEEFKALTRPDGTIKAKAAELIKGAGTDEEKLRRIYNFCQTEISNLDYFDSADLQKAKKRVDAKDPNPRSTLTIGAGYSRQINELFAALAKGAGFEVMLARSSSRAVTLNVKNQNGWVFLRDDLVCVKHAKGWKQYAPGDYHIPAGMIHSSNELAPSLICQPDKVVIQNNGMARANESVEAHKGRLVLDEEGNLEGEVELTLTGHRAAKWRGEWHSQQQAEIDKAFIEKIAERLPAAEVTELVWTGLRDNRQPLVARYKLKVPAYADAIGSKLILPINVFQKGVPAVFPSDQRRHPVYFDHAWSETDDVEIVLPEGATLAEASAPAAIGAASEAVGAAYQLDYQSGGRILQYQRKLVVGGNGAIAFQPASYRPLKRIFDAVKRSDDHTVVVEVGEPASAGAAGSAASTP